MDTHTVSGTFKYLKWQDIYKTVKPYMSFPSSLSREGKPSSNIVFEVGPEEEVRDARHYSQGFNLDKNGFVFRKLPSSVTDFADSEQIERVLTHEYEGLIRQEVGDVSKICLYDWRIRGSDINEEGQAVEGAKKGGRTLPVAGFVHVDYSAKSALKYAKRVLDEEDVGGFLSRRFQILNIWRPINGPVQDSALALCDWTTLDTKKVITFDAVRKTHTGEFMLALYDPQRSWYYMSDQDNDDLVLFKNYDSREDVAQFVLHSPFMLPGLQPDRRHRRSIEFRFIVFV
ncbi:hypothetical protein HIM_03082 [Hirsutella minnesotensis 3608]|nr:hypothetical protein HIM_03082 [Hirsutella minnesotensis 3608]